MAAYGCTRLADLQDLTNSELGLGHRISQVSACPYGSGYSFRDNVQIGKSEKPGPLDDPTRPYIRFDIIAHLDTLSSHEHKRV